VLADAAALTGVAARPRLGDLVDRAEARYGKTLDAEPRRALAEFLIERLQHFFEIRGGDRRNGRAVLAERGLGLNVSVADLQGNLRALAEFAKAEQFRQLATAFKRVRNIARELPDAEFDADEARGGDLAAILVEPAEQALLKELRDRQAVIEGAVRQGTGFREAYLEASKFGPTVERFFNDVFVMADDAALKRGRLRLLKRLERLILQLGDISEIVALES
jgi:glycyl-tRNA synthetase beta chain